MNDGIVQALVATAGLLAIVAYSIFLYWYLNKNNTDTSYDMEEVKKQVDKIYYLKTQLQKVDELLIDVELADSDNIKGIAIEWQTAAGTNLDVDLWIDGKTEVTKSLYNLAYKRREEILSSLSAEIKKLALWQRQNEDKTTALLKGESANK